MRELVFTKQADDDLDGIYSYILINSFSPEPANRITDNIRQKIKFLTEYPHIGSIRPDFTDNPSIRFLPVHSHHIVYKFDDETLIILRILHGAQDLPTHLQNE